MVRYLHGECVSVRDKQGGEAVRSVHHALGCAWRGGSVGGHAGRKFALQDVKEALAMSLEAAHGGKVLLEG